tara:strand:+ start:543 stop:1049 length:507 start_codon:yes stop_codon:yes gene_type:complete
MVIWVIGLAAAGKTVIGKELYSELKKKYSNLVFLDGDIIREIMGNDLEHTLEDRKKNADRICRLCETLDEQGIHVVCSILSIFHESQEWNRQNYSQYFEIYVDVSMDILIKRDKKKLYTNALDGNIKNVVGLDIPFEPPKKPDFIIHNNNDRDNFKEIIQDILKSLPS